MNVLLVNSFFYNRGGDCTYFFSLKRLLEKTGHKVVVFSMRHPQNFGSKYEHYFVNHIDYVEEAKKKTLHSLLKVLCRTIYSREAKDKIAQLIKDERIDVAHLQSIHHHITPSILYPLKRHRIPIIWTLHDFTIMCPNTTFYCHGNICERCKKIRYYWPPLVRCKKNSFMASTMAAAENAIHRIMRVYDLVDFFITPSQFLRHKLIEYGFEKDKILHINNFVEMTSFENKEDTGNYCLFAGRLSEEKGLKTLIDAAFKVRAMRLKIIGTGPLEQELIRYARSKNGPGIVEFIGHVSHADAIELLSNSSFAVVPSEWYENLPYSILEAFACQKPVIASRIGGLPAFVTDGVTGLLFEPYDAQDLAAKITWMNAHPKERKKMGRTAREVLGKEYNPDKHYTQLMAVYETARKNYRNRF